VQELSSYRWGHRWESAMKAEPDVGGALGDDSGRQEADAYGRTRPRTAEPAG
jgi:hypothetical protein